MSFTVAQVNHLDANADTIEARRMFRIDFSTGTVRLIEGVTPRTDADGAVWQPSHTLISAEGMASGAPLEAVPCTYRASDLTPGLTREAITNRAIWFGRRMQQSMQLYAAGAAVGPAIVLHTGTIQDIERVQTADEEYLSIRVESVFAKRNAAPLGKYTDRDQKRRSPGDRGCEYAAYLADKGKSSKGWLRA